MTEDQMCCDNCGKWYPREMMLKHTGRSGIVRWTYQLCSESCLRGMLEWWGDQWWGEEA